MSNSQAIWVWSKCSPQSQPPVGPLYSRMRLFWPDFCLRICRSPRFEQTQCTWHRFTGVFRFFCAKWNMKEFIEPVCNQIKMHVMNLVRFHSVRITAHYQAATQRPWTPPCMATTTGRGITRTQTKPRPPMCRSAPLWMMSSLTLVPLVPWKPAAWRTIKVTHAHRLLTGEGRETVNCKSEGADWSEKMFLLVQNFFLMLFCSQSINLLI